MKEQKSILIVEDEDKIRTALKDFLEFHGFGVLEAEDGLEAQQMVSEQRFDLILLDLMLPKISGEQLCSRWRREDMPTPIIMLTAKGQQTEKIAGLNLGADDYITKPFSLEELLARIKAIFRRTDPARKVGQCFKFGELEVDISAMKIRMNKQQIDISKKEGKILQYFAANPNRVVSREELYKQVWGEDMSEFGTRTTDMHIAKLRSKIEQDSSEPELIKTVRGSGYIYEI